MSVSDAIPTPLPDRAAAAPLEITVGEAAERRLQPMPKPEGAAFGYLHAERREPVVCSWTELADACRAGHALLAWTPETAQMVDPREVPRLPAAILEADLADAHSRRAVTLILLAVMGLVALYFPTGWLFAAVAVLIAWSANQRVREAEARTPDDIDWHPGSAEATPLPDVRAPSPYSFSIGLALAAVGVVQTMVLGREWLDGMWDPADVDGWLRPAGGPMVHAESLSLLFSCVVLGGMAPTLEKEAPRAYLPISFVAGALAAIGADLLLPGSLPPGPLGGLMGMAGFYSVLAARHAEHGSALAWLTNRTMGLSASALVLAFLFATAPLSGAGLLAGIGLGLLCIPRPGEIADDASAGEGWAAWLGMGSLGLIWLSALAAILSLVIG